MIPLVQQITKYACAAAAFQAAMAERGILTDQEDLMNIMGTKPEIGTSSSGIVAACVHYRIPYLYRTFLELRDMKQHLEAGQQVITAVQLWGSEEFSCLSCNSFDSGHYINPMKVTDTHVYFMDPFVARYLKLSCDEFYCRWHNEFGNRYTDQMAIILT